MCSYLFLSLGGKAGSSKLYGRLGGQRPAEVGGWVFLKAGAVTEKAAIRWQYLGEGSRRLATYLTWYGVQMSFGASQRHWGSLALQFNTLLE